MDAVFVVLGMQHFLFSVPVSKVLQVVLLVVVFAPPPRSWWVHTGICT